MEDKKDPFIEQTARDYDIPYHEVERIYKLYPDNFYEELEIYIRKRSQIMEKKLNNLISFSDFEKNWKPEEPKKTKRTEVGLDIVKEGYKEDYEVAKKLSKLDKVSVEKAESILSGFKSGAQLDQMREYWAAMNKRDFKKAAEVVKKHWC